MQGAPLADPPPPPTFPGVLDLPDIVPIHARLGCVVVFTPAWCKTAKIHRNEHTLGP